MKITTGDNLNNYKNDVIDGYEKERQTEHRGEMLQGNPVYGEDGIFDSNILITRIEFANGLTFKESFSASTFDVDTIFADYGKYNANNQVKALRVWSGNDHWLLTKESANKYLKILPLGSIINASSYFSLVYWTGTDEELKTAISNNDLKGCALFYHDGNSSGGGGGSTTDSLIDFTVDAPTTTESKDKSESVSFSGSTTNLLGDILIPQTWENIDHVYLKKAPSLTKFALAPDDRILPLFDGTLTIVYKNGETFDITTFTKLSYFYTFKELRGMEEQEIINFNNVPEFDWEKTGGINSRHIPLLIVNPDNTSQKMRVLDLFDEDEKGEVRDQYTIEVGSETIYEPEMKDGFKLMKLPTILNITYSDLVLKIDGLRVAKVVDGINVSYLDADSGKLYLKEPNIYDHEKIPDDNFQYSKIERVVYGKEYDDSDEVEVMTITWPPVDATPDEILKQSGVALPTTKDDTETTESGEVVPVYSEDETASTLANAQIISMGTSEVETTPENSIFRMYATNDLKKKWFKRLFGWGKKIVDKVRHVIDRIKKGVPKVISVIKEKTEKVKNFFSKVEKVTQKVEKFIKNSNDTVISVPQSDFLIDITSHYTPPIPQGVTPEANGRIKWGKLFSQFYKKISKKVTTYRKSLGQLVHRVIKGGKRLYRNFTKVVNVKRAYQFASVEHKYILVNGSLYESSSDTWKDVNIVPRCEDAMITGFDEESTADTMPVKITTQGMQQVVVLHHPQAVSSQNALVGLRCIKQPKTEVIGYGEQVNNTTGDVGEWVGVDAQNNDVPLTTTHTFGILKSPGVSLTIANGGIVAKSINWQPGVATGQVDLEVQATASAMQCFAKMGYSISSHLLTATNSNGLLSGIRRLINKAREFFRKHPKLTKMGKRALSWSTKQFKKKFPKLAKNVAGVLQTSNGILYDNDEAVPDEEQTVVMNTTAVTLSNDVITQDQQVEDITRQQALAVYFDATFPEDKMITLENIQKFFNDARVALLFDGDEGLPVGQGGAGVGTGFNRTYLESDEFIPPERLASDLLEFGTAIVSIRGMAFDLKGSLLSPYKEGCENYKLILAEKPTRTIYTFGEKEIDLSGASWNLVDQNGNIIISSLTKDNVFVDSLPTNIEECMLEEPTNEDDKTQINAYFMGFINTEIRVTLLHPYVVAQEELQQNNEISLSTSLGIFSALLMLAPLGVSIWSRLRKKKKNANGTFSDDYENITTWPTSIKTLMEYLGAKVVLKDNFMRRKSFPVSEMSETLFNKLFSVENYDATTTDETQEITINIMGHTTKKAITLADLKYISEENLVNGVVDTSKLSDTPPEDWDGTTPESAGGVDITVKPDTTTGILYLAHEKINSMKTPIYSTTGKLLNTYYSNAVTEPSVLSRGQTEIGSIFATPINHIMRADTGLRFHQINGIKKWFKKLAKKVKKIANKVVQVVKKVIDVAKKVVDTVVKVGTKIIETGNQIVGAVDKVAGTGISSIIPSGTSSYMIESEIRGKNQELIYQPIYTKSNATGLPGGRFPWGGIKSISYNINTTKNGVNVVAKRLCHVYGHNKRILGMFMHRAPQTVPGFGSFAMMRRTPEVYPSGFGGVVQKLSAVNDTDVQFDILEMAGVTVYDPENTNLTDESSLSGMAFFEYSLCFSSQELCMGDVWPSVEEMKQLVNLYAQRSDNTNKYEWVTIPLSHSAITVEGYSNIDDNAEQFITIHLKTDTGTLTTWVVLHKTSSEKSIVNENDQCYVWVIPNLLIEYGFLIYLGDKRTKDKRLVIKNSLGEVSDISFASNNDTSADRIKILLVENRTILSVEDYKDNADSITFVDQIDPATNKVIAIHGVFMQNNSENITTEYTLYGFEIEDLEETDCSVVYRMGITDEIYIDLIKMEDYFPTSEFDILKNTMRITQNLGYLQYQQEQNGLVVFGHNHIHFDFVPSTTIRLPHYFKVDSYLNIIQEHEG